MICTFTERVEGIGPGWMIHHDLINLDPPYWESLLCYYGKYVTDRCGVNSQVNAQRLIDYLMAQLN